MELRYRIRRQRIAAGISVSALAKVLGVSRSWLSLREGGFTRVNDADAKRIYGAIHAIVEKRFNLVEEEMSA